ncbi:MAG: sodium-dependent bicarbonate transport family permease, partial [Roseiflexaceae bacterium]
MNKNELFIYFSDYIADDTIFLGHVPTTARPSYPAPRCHVRAVCRPRTRKGIMDSILIVNLISPITLAFLLGIFATIIRSDLEIPEPVIRIFSIFLLFSIGLQGGR